MTDLLIRPKRGGKTSAAIEALRQDPNWTLVCINAREAARIIHENPDLNGRVKSLHDIRRSAGLGSTHRLIVDNLDMMLPELFGADVAVATWSESFPAQSEGEQG